MSTIHPWRFLVITVAGWINRHQQDVIDYLVEENRVLKGQLRGRHVRLTDDERRRLAVKGKARAFHKIRMPRPDDLLHREIPSESGHVLLFPLSPGALPPGARQPIDRTRRERPPRHRHNSMP